MKPARVQKLLAQAGVASRRKCEDLIKQGRVTVNGKVVLLGATATSDDDIRVDDKSTCSEKHVYIALHKPGGVTSTVKDPHAKKTVLDIVKAKERVFPVGRLDKDTEGIMLLTNDGQLMNKLLHPRYGVTKTYEIVTEEKISKRAFQRLRQGIRIEGRKVGVDNATLLRKNKVRLSIHEGRKRIVRKVFESLGYTIQRLVRVRFGSLKLGRLPRGRWRHLVTAEVKALQQSCRAHR